MWTRGSAGQGGPDKPPCCIASRTVPASSVDADEASNDETR